MALPIHTSATLISVQQTDAAQALEMAFKAFSELSGELNQRWQALEGQVRHLTQELEAANNQRLKELADKVRIARRLQKLLQLLPGGVLVLNAQGRITDCGTCQPHIDSHFIINILFGTPPQPVSGS
jgi:two-component system sensor histidine kinase FlrB